MNPSTEGWTESQLTRNFQRIELLLKTYLHQATRRIGSVNTAVGTASATTATTLLTVPFDSDELQVKSILSIVASGSVSGTNDSKTATVKFGADNIATATFSAAQTGDWIILAWVLNTGSLTAQRYASYSLQNIGGTPTLSAMQTATTALDSEKGGAGVHTVTVVGTTPNASDEVTAHFLGVWHTP